MFGHQDNKDKDFHDDHQDDTSQMIQPDDSDQSDDSNKVMAPPLSQQPDDGISTDSSDSDNNTENDESIPDNHNHPKPEPVGDESGSPSSHLKTDDKSDKDASLPKPKSSSGLADTDEGGLLDIKKDALTELSPLVSNLDQTPEEKFKTTMMMIQASDNKALIKDAYRAAQDIKDEKTRAQALLDVINEINYFTQKPDDNQNSSL